jgi:hypothetical protein
MVPSSIHVLSTCSTDQNQIELIISKYVLWCWLNCLQHWTRSTEQRTLLPSILHVLSTCSNIHQNNTSTQPTTSKNIGDLCGRYVWLQFSDCDFQLSSPCMCPAASTEC